MSVPKGKRKESEFEVFIHFYRMRKDITDLLLRDFGYKEKKQEKYIEKMFGGIPYEEMNDVQKEHYNKAKEKTEAFHDWYIVEQRETIMRCLRRINQHIFMANSIYPQYESELIERRIEQDRAIRECNVLIQELQYIINTLPVDVNKYVRFSDAIQREINLIKGRRKSDNKFKKKF
jgi:hypothetical protein